ncbi:MAG: hypothetical protein KC933_23305, partial [Myxococcales bacterium]|nr:hypothetical protein [Myxococcales bacterium]
ALGHLEALHRAGRADAAVAQAKALLGAPGLAGRRAEVLRVLAEAEVLRGRCDEARAAFEQAREAGADITEDAVQGALQACARRSPR